MDMNPKYPHINVALVGEDGNAFSIIARVTRALERGGIAKAERDAFMAEAMSGDYSHLLVTVTNWVAVDGLDDEPVAWYGPLDDEDEYDEDDDVYA